MFYIQKWEHPDKVDTVLDYIGPFDSKEITSYNEIINNNNSKEQKKSGNNHKGTFVPYQGVTLHRAVWYLLLSSMLSWM